MYKIMLSLNGFFSETACPIFTRFHMGPSVEEVLTICSKGSAPLIKIATMPVYGKTHFFSSIKNGFRLNIGIKQWASMSAEFVQMMILGWPVTFLRKGQFVWENVEKLFFSKCVLE